MQQSWYASFSRSLCMQMPFRQHKRRLDTKFDTPLQVGAFLALMLNQTAEAAYARLQHMEPFMCFRDASSGPSCFGLTVNSTIQVILHPDSFQASQHDCAINHFAQAHGCCRAEI